MRALVLSDIHGNIDALQAFDRQWAARLHEFDHVIVLGDLVDYGPAPHDVIEWVRAHATDVVRGNHDHAMATRESCRSSAGYREAATVTRDLLRPTLTSADLRYLGDLEVTRTIADGQERWRLAHATPRDPLFAYLRPADGRARWVDELAGWTGGGVLLGHTHLAFCLRVGATLAVNPGSLGMPKDGHPSGSYAIIDGDSVQFRRVEYDTAATISRLRTIGLPDRVFAQLAGTFHTGLCE